MNHQQLAEKIRREIQSYAIWAFGICTATLLFTAAIWLWQSWDAAKPWPGWGVLALALRGYIAIARINHWNQD